MRKKDDRARVMEILQNIISIPNLDSIAPLNIRGMVTNYHTLISQDEREFTIDQFISALEDHKVKTLSVDSKAIYEFIINYLIASIGRKPSLKKSYMSVNTQREIEKNVTCHPKKVLDGTNKKLKEKEDKLNIKNEQLLCSINKIEENNKKLKEQESKLIEINEQLMCSIETVEVTNEELDVSIKEMKTKHKKNDSLLQDIKMKVDSQDKEFKKLKGRERSIGKEIVQLKEQLEPYEKETQELLNKRSEILCDYRNKFNSLHEVVSKNELIIKGFNLVGFNDSDVDKSLKVIDFQEKDASFDNLITTYKNLLECPVVNWQRKFEYYLEKVNLSDKKEIKTVKELSEKLSLVLLIPQKNDRFNALEHTAQSEEESSDVDRGRVMKVVSIGIKDADVVKQKAKVILSK